MGHRVEQEAGPYCTNPPASFGMFKTCGRAAVNCHLSAKQAHYRRGTAIERLCDVNNVCHTGVTWGLIRRCVEVAEMRL